MAHEPRDSHPRIAVFGAGSIGGPIAAHLLRAGHAVGLYTGNEAITQAIGAAGLQVLGARGDFTVRAAASTAPAAGDGPYDVALLAMKNDRLAEGVRTALTVLAPDGYVVCLQNGVPEPSAAAVAGAARVAGAVVSWGSSMEGPGRCRVTSRGPMALGEAAGAPGARLQALARTLTAAGLPSKVAPDLAGVRWSKLAVNCTITTLGALTGLRVGRMVAHAGLRRVAFTVMSEVLEVAAAAGVRPALIAGAIDPRVFHVPRGGGGSTARALVRHAILGLAAVRYRRLRSGITRSLERGRPPEIDALNGFVARRGAELGVRVPLNEALVSMVAELAAGRRRPSPTVWQELAPHVRG